MNIPTYLSNPAKRISSKVDLDTLTKLLGLTGPDDFYENFWLMDNGTYSHIYDEAIREGASEDEAEERALKIEQEEQDEAFRKYKNAVEHIADKLFEEHGLTLVPSTQNSYEYTIVPTESWKDAADKIRETINGVGYFYFSSLREFLSSGPYTAREAVLSHVGWIKDWPRVYGEGTTQSMFDRQMRY